MYYWHCTYSFHFFFSLAFSHLLLLISFVFLRAVIKESYHYSLTKLKWGPPLFFWAVSKMFMHVWVELIALLSMILRCTFEQNIVKVVQLLVSFALEFQRSPLCLGCRLRVQLLSKKVGLPIFEWAPSWYLFSPLFMSSVYLFILNALFNKQLFCFALCRKSPKKKKVLALLYENVIRGGRTGQGKKRWRRELSVQSFNSLFKYINLIWSKY